MATIGIKAAVNNRASLTAPQIDGHEIQSLLHNCAASLAPYGIHASLGHTDKDKWISSLFSELTIYAPFFRKRSLTSIWIRDMPTEFVSVSDFTEVVYTLSSCLKHTKSSRKVFGVEVTPAGICRKKLTLYKGLGVNSLLVTLDSEIDRQAVNPSTVELLSQFGFNNVMCRIPTTLLQGSESKTWLNFLSGLGVSTIIASNDQITGNPASINAALSMTGFLPFAEDPLLLSAQNLTQCLAAQQRQPKDEQDSPFPITDWIGIGTSAIGKLSNRHYQNYASEKGYFQALNQRQLPIELLL